MIIFQEVTKQFGDGTIALDELSFEVEPGEFVFITGHSGSGKTTLMRLLTKEYLPSAGEVFFADQPLSQLRSRQVPHHRRQLGVVFQDYKLLPDFTVWENIALPLNIAGQKAAEIESRVNDLLKLVNLTDKAFVFPSQLSGGEAQRVSIARALANAPSLIFADEPTGNLDPDTSATIAQLLHKINELGTTVLFATHDVGVLAALPKLRRIHLEAGKLVSDTKTDLTKAKAKKSPVDEQQPPVEHHSHSQDLSDTKDTKSASANERDDEASEPEAHSRLDHDHPKEKPKTRFSLSWPKLPWSKKSAHTATHHAESNEEKTENKDEVTVKTSQTSTIHKDTKTPIVKHDPDDNQDDELEVHVESL